MKQNIVLSVFSVKKDIIQKWIEDVTNDCVLPEMKSNEEKFGGALFARSDPSTHWTQSDQLITWWKNNIDRRTKFKVLQEDASYSGTDVRKIQR
jgi:hypothetical protein